jgi:hypothetical protein
MLELNNEFGDLYEMICDREIEIVHELQVVVLSHVNTLLLFQKNALKLLFPPLLRMIIQSRSQELLMNWILMIHLS